MNGGRTHVCYRSKEGGALMVFSFVGAGQQIGNTLPNMYSMACTQGSAIFIYARRSLYT